MQKVRVEEGKNNLLNELMMVEQKLGRIIRLDRLILKLQRLRSPVGHIEGKRSRRENSSNLVNNLE